jgi:hypothetical protein
MQLDCVAPHARVSRVGVGVRKHQLKSELRVEAKRCADVCHHQQRLHGFELCLHDDEVRRRLLAAELKPVATPRSRTRRTSAPTSRKHEPQLARARCAEPRGVAPSWHGRATARRTESSRGRTGRAQRRTRCSHRSRRSRARARSDEARPPPGAPRESGASRKQQPWAAKRIVPAKVTRRGTLPRAARSVTCSSLSTRVPSGPRR